MTLAFIGMLVVACVIGVGVYHIATRVTLKDTPPRYTYRTDENGNDAVTDETDR